MQILITNYKQTAGYKLVSFEKQLMDSGAVFEFCYLKVQLQNKGLNY